MNKYQWIIFDLDGTLTDSQAGIIRSLQYALKKFGLTKAEEELLAFIGPPLIDSFKEHCGFDEKKARQAVDYYREYYTERGIYENAVYPGIPELLARLHGDGRTMALATAKPAVFARRILLHFGLERFFSATAGSSLDGSGTSKSGLIRSMLSELETLTGQKRMHNAVMVGDRSFDIMGAQENGIDSIGVEYGYGQPGELASAGSTHLAGSVEELADILVSNS